MARLMATHGPMKGAFFAFAEACLIGRDPASTVALAEPTASRRHTEIRADGARWIVRDLKSQNGTFVNGRKIKEMALVHGDLLSVGDHTFVFQEDAPQGSTLLGAPPRRFQIGTTIEDVELVGESPAFRSCLAAAEKVAAADAPVLVTGETGTGKELITRWIHRSSKRPQGPFVAVNCAAIPETLFESELFGAEEGAFTGATARREGKFELATGGTLFLDEIGELPLPLQPKLLRALQERTFYRVGGTREVASDVRIVAATNRDLPQAVGLKVFREDLYHRLAALPVRVPALRERREDIPILARHVAARTARRLGKPHEGIRDAALARLSQYSWPGNIRELQNVVERAVILSDGPMLEAAAFDLAGPSQSPSAEDPQTLSLASAEKEAIRRALAKTRGLKGEAAKLLGVSWPTLRRKICVYRLEPELPKASKTKERDA